MYLVLLQLMHACNQSLLIIYSLFTYLSSHLIFYYLFSTLIELASFITIFARESLLS
jgi:hypothetical protein